MKLIPLLIVICLLFGCYSTEIITGSYQDVHFTDQNCLRYPVAYVSGDREVIVGRTVYLWLMPHPLVCKNSITGYEWSQVAGPPVYLTNTGSNYTSFVAPPEYEDIVFKVVIKGEENNYTDYIKIRVVDREQNTVPFADADGDIILPVGYVYKSNAYYSLGTNKADMSYLWTTFPETNTKLSLSSGESPEPLITLLSPSVVPQIVLLEAIENELHSTRDIKLIYTNNQSHSVILPPRLEPVSSSINAPPKSAVVLKIKDINRYDNARVFWFQLSGEKVNYESLGSDLHFSSPPFLDEIVFAAHALIDGLFSPPIFFKVKVGNQNGFIDPIADAGPDQRAKTLSEVKLNGSKSVVGYPRKITYKWRQVYGSSVNIKDADTAFPSFTAPRITGKIILMLTVSDGYIDSRPDSVVIDVTND